MAEEPVVLSLLLDGSPATKSPRERSQTFTMTNKVLDPEVGTASAVMDDKDAARDDMYIEGATLRRGFASEFLDMLEVAFVGTL